MLSPTNVDLLAKLLESAGRLDLLPLVQQTEAEGKLKWHVLSPILAFNLPLKRN